jgi:lysophospholipase L1-like esterase
MKCLILFAMAAGLWAQTDPPQTNPPTPSAQGAMLSQQDAEQLATRMLQLMESTAVAVPGLVRASEPVKQNAQMTFTAMQRTPQNPALIYQFMNQVKAYLALSDSIPRPYPFPPTADQQYTELRESLQRMQQHFEAILQVQNLDTQKRDNDPNNLKHYANANSKLLPPGKLPRVVFLGDSITENWRINEYFVGRDFINRGISNQTTLQMVARFLEDVAALRPKVVVIEAGTNDIAAGLPANQIQDNLATLGDLAKVYGIKAVFASILPVSDYHKDADPRNEMTKTRAPATIQAVNRWMQMYCQTEGLTYIDYYAAMVDQTGQMQTDLSDDGLHPNSKGYRVMSPIALEAIGRVIAGVSDTSAEAKKKFHILGR